MSFWVVCFVVFTLVGDGGQKQIKDSRKQKETAAVKEQLRMQKRVELLQQRILSKSAGNLHESQTTGEGNVPKSDVTCCPDDDEAKHNQLRESTHTKEAPEKGQSRQVTSSFVARQTAAVSKAVAPRDFA